MLEVLLLDWANLCGIVATASDKIRRILHPAHEELIAVGYLENVSFTGRGARQMVTYRFQKVNAPDPALVNLLLGLRITRPRAEQLAAEYPERVEAAVKYVELRTQLGKVKSPAALAYDILVKPEKYDLESGGVSLSSKSSSPKLPDKTVLEKQAQEEFESKQEQLLTLSPEQQWDAMKSTLKLLVSKHIGDAEFDEIRQACLQGKLNVTDLARELSIRKAKGTDEVTNFLAKTLTEIGKLENI